MSMGTVGVLMAKRVNNTLLTVFKMYVNLTVGVPDNEREIRTADTVPEMTHYKKSTKTTNSYYAWHFVKVNQLMYHAPHWRQYL